MNPQPQNNLETKLTALLLGELPSSEAFELGRAIEHDPELAKIYQRLEKTIGLVKETSSVPAPAEHPEAPAALRLSDQRREALLQAFKTVRPKTFATTPHARSKVRVIQVAAVFATFIVVVSVAVFSLSKRYELSTTLVREDRLPRATVAVRGPRQTDVLESGRNAIWQIRRELAETPPARPRYQPAHAPIVLPAPETAPASAGDRLYTVTAGSGGEQQRGGSLAPGSDAKLGGKLEWVGANDGPAGIHSDTNAFIGRYAYATGSLLTKDEDVEAIRKRIDHSGNASTPSSGIGLQGGTAPAPGQPGADAALTAKTEQPVAETPSTPLYITGSMSVPGNKTAFLQAKPPAAGQAGSGAINLANSTTPIASPTPATPMTDKLAVASVDFDASAVAPAVDPATGLPLPGAAPAAVEEKVRREVRLMRPADSIDPATGLPLTMPEVAATTAGTTADRRVRAFEVDPSKLSQALDTVARAPTPVAQPNEAARVETAGGSGGGGAGGGGIATVTRTNAQTTVQSDVRKLLADAGVTLDASKGENVFFNDREGKLIVSADPEKLKQIDSATRGLQPGQAAGEPASPSFGAGHYSPNSTVNLGDVPALGRVFTNGTTASAGKPLMAARTEPPPITPSPSAVTNSPQDVIPAGMVDFQGLNLDGALQVYADLDNKKVLRAEALPDIKLKLSPTRSLTKEEARQAIDAALAMNGIALIPMGNNVVKAVPLDKSGAFGGGFNKPASTNTVMAANNFWDASGASKGGRAESEPPRQQIVLPPSEQQLTLSDDVGGVRRDWFEAEKKESGARYDGSTVYRATTPTETAVAADGIEGAKGRLQELNRSKSQDEFKNSGTPGKIALSFSTTPAQTHKTPETLREARQKEGSSNVYGQNIVGYANVAIKDGKSFYANPFTNKPGLEKEIAAGIPSQIAEQEKEVERLRKELKVPDSLTLGDGPVMLMSAEAVRKLDAERIELESALVRDKTVLTNLSRLPKADLEKVLPARAPDNQLTSLVEQRTLNEQALAQKKQQSGENNPDVVKTKETIDDLNQKISDRVDGLMISLEQRVKAGENALEVMTSQVEKAKSNDISSASAMRPYFDAKNKLEELKRFNQALTIKSASETIESAAPKSTMVAVLDPATADKATSSLWDKLQGKYETKARIKLENDKTDIPGLSDGKTTAEYDPYFIQNEFQTIQSDAVLGRAVTNLNLSREWGRKDSKDGRLSNDEAVKKLRKMLDVKPVKGTTFLDIGAKADKPDEAARLANAVAQAYQDYRQEERRELSRRGITALKEAAHEQERKISEQQAVVDRLRREALENADLAPRKPSTNAPIHQAEVATAENAFSTFSLNVSDVSFKLAAATLEKGALPEPASVRSEEFINAFDYRDPEPPAGVPVGFAWDRAQYPFAQNRDVLRFSIKTAAQGRQAGSPLNLVLLLDNSGSMERADRVHIIHESLRVLAGQLQAQDKLSVVLFSRTARLLVDGVSGTNAAKVAEEVSGLTPEGGTNLEEAMNLAYQTAARHYLANGINRVVLLTDGAANLGDVEPESLKQKVEANRKQGIALDCFGIGWEGYNDDLLEVLSRNGDGRYGFINSPEEAASEFAAQLAGALNVAASDVKVQVEFNPARVKAWRQVGYAKHQLTKEQFRDNTVDAAEIAAAESGNAVYVIEVNSNGNGPLGTVRVRFKVPGTTDYREHEWAVPYSGNAAALEQASPAMRLAATASAFSEWLAANPYAGEINLDRLLSYLSGVPETYGADARPRKLEWMLRQTRSLAGRN